MKIDIVFPKNNEAEFIRLAEKLGWDGLCFICKEKTNQKKIDNLKKQAKLKLFTGIIAEPKNIQKAKKFSNLVIVKSSEKDQHILEKSPPDILSGVESYSRKDSMHFRSSGLNQVLCRLAKKNNTIIPISIKQITESKNKPMILGRIMQNIMLCKKYNVSQAVASFAQEPYELKSPADMMSLAVSLGMNIPDAKKSLTSVYEKIISNKKKKSPDYIGKGIEIVK